RRNSADNIRLDHNVGRSANHQEMLDVVAPHQNKPAPIVDAGVIDHRKSRLPAARTGAEPTTAEPSHGPPNCADHAEYDEKRHEKAPARRQFRPAPAPKP